MMPAQFGPDSAPPAARAAPPLDELRASLEALRKWLAESPDRSDGYAALYVLCADLLGLVENRIRELDPHAELAADQLASVCIFLGPYRNLTTLTASVLALHRQCVVLNHAGRRTLRNRRINFLADGSPDKLAEFVRYAGFAARGGERGMHGGDIRLSHAFDRDAMRRADAQLAHAGKGPVRCLVWKESQRVTNFLRDARVDVARLMDANPKLRLILPVRNPIDCAISNVRRGHVRLLARHHALSPESSMEDVVGAVLDEIAWFAALRESSRCPERFFVYFEHEIGRSVLEGMLAFLGLPADPDYLAAATKAFKADRASPKEPRLVSRYAEMVREKFSRQDDIRNRLLQFLPR
jgi:hypothetical protein